MADRKAQSRSLEPILVQLQPGSLCRKINPMKEKNLDTSWRERLSYNTAMKHIQ